MGYFRRTFESINRKQDNEFRLLPSEAYESTVHKFLRTFAERLLIEYCNASEKMPELQKSSPQNPKVEIKYKAELARL